MTKPEDVDRAHLHAVVMPADVSAAIQVALDALGKIRGYVPVRVGIPIASAQGKLRVAAMAVDAWAATGNSGTTFCSSDLQHWGVDVRANGEHVLTIESNCLSGRQLSHVDEEAIRTAAQHLLAFVGEESREAKRAREAMRSEIVN